MIFETVKKNTKSSSPNAFWCFFFDTTEKWNICLKSQKKSFLYQAPQMHSHPYSDHQILNWLWNYHQQKHKKNYFFLKQAK